MKNIFILIATAMMLWPISSNGLEASPGRVDRLTLTPSGLGAQRNIEVWLPEGYDTTRKYAVIYMNDGQMLFDSTTTWNRQEWGADEVAAKLVAENKIRPCIIVGIWNRDQYRYSEYFPEKALSFYPARRRARLIKKEMMGEPLGDEYLSFLVAELKPYIDSHYSTLTDRENTIIMGASMGGLISLYAICEYPDVFGGAGCMSTHLPMIGLNFFRTNDNRMAKAFRKYLSANLPSPENHKIYFDHGTKTLDAAYAPYQKKVDKLMSAAGYTEKNWITIKYEGHDHSERSWSGRLNVPFEFLVGK
jgi:predicted alpha/beta superfamily hydrolase